MLTGKQKKKREGERRTEQKTSLCHYVNPLNDPTCEVVFVILILPPEKDTDNWRMLRGGEV